MYNGGAIGLPGASACWQMAITENCPMCCTFAISIILNSVSVICGEEHKSAFLQERCMAHTAPGTAIVFFTTALARAASMMRAVWYTVTLGIGKVQQFLVSPWCRGGFSGPSLRLGGLSLAWGPFPSLGAFP